MAVLDTLLIAKINIDTLLTLVENGLLVLGFSPADFVRIKKVLVLTGDTNQD